MTRPTQHISPRPKMSDDLDTVLGWFEARHQEGHDDLALVCWKCDESLCDIEAGDPLDVLVRVALAHECKEEAVA